MTSEDALHGLRFFFDPDGRPRAEADRPELAVLADFLQSDVARDLVWADELYRRAKAGSRWRSTINVYEIETGRKMVTLQPLHQTGQPASTFPGSLVAEALRAWISHVKPE